MRVITMNIAQIQTKHINYKLNGTAENVIAFIEINKWKSTVGTFIS